MLPCLLTAVPSAHRISTAAMMMKHVLAMLQVHTASAVIWRVCPQGCDFRLPSLAVRQAANGMSAPESSVGLSAPESSVGLVCLLSLRAVLCLSVSLVDPPPSTFGR